MSGGGSFRLSFVSVETALCVGPRNVVQSCVVAPAGSGFGFATTRACARATPASSGCAMSDCSKRRREMGNMITVRLKPDTTSRSEAGHYVVTREAGHYVVTREAGHYVVIVIESFS